MQKDIKYILIILTLFIIPFSVNATLPQQSIAPERNYVEGQVIIKYKDSIKKEISSIITNDSSLKSQKFQINKFPQKLQKKIDEKQINIGVNFNDLNIITIKSTKKSTKELIKEYKNDENIEYIEPNYIRTLAFTPNDPYFSSSQWAHYRNDDHDIDSTEAWNIEQNTATKTVVAVIDTGVDYNAINTGTELNMWDGSTTCFDDASPPASISCPYHGWDYDGDTPYYVNPYDDDNDPDATSTSYQWHGTHVSSIFGAITNNSTGISGISRYNNIEIMAIRSDLTTINILRSINFAKNNGAKVINASFGGSGYSQAEKDAINAFPGILVAATGNNSANNDTSAMYPCNYNLNNIICVGATNTEDELTSFSNYGNIHVDIAAPGKSILGIENDNYYYGDGTSFSTPLVSGTAALLYAHNPTASISTIKNTLLKSSDHIISLNDKISCSRRLNVHKSLQSIINDAIPTESCPTPIYRFYSRKYQSHLYTSSESEKNNIINNWPTDIWEYQRIEFSGYDKTSPNVSSVYRFWSKKYRTLYYTTSSQERDGIINDWPNEIWEYQGPRLYVYTTASEDRTPVYRMWSKKYKASYFTTNINQRDCMIKKYPDYIWRYENISWWVPKEGLDSSVITKC